MKRPTIAAPNILLNCVWQHFCDVQHLALIPPFRIFFFTGGYVSLNWKAIQTKVKDRVCKLNKVVKCRLKGSTRIRDKV